MLLCIFEQLKITFVKWICGEEDWSQIRNHPDMNTFHHLFYIMIWQLDYNTFRQAEQEPFWYQKSSHLKPGLAYNIKQNVFWTDRSLWTPLEFRQMLKWIISQITNSDLVKNNDQITMITFCIENKRNIISKSKLI